MPGVNTPEGVVVPAAGDTFDYLGEMRRKANSQRTVVTVADRAAAEVVAAAMATDGRPVSNTNPLVVYNQGKRAIEVKDGTGWVNSGIKCAFYSTPLSNSNGGIIPVGALTVEASLTKNNTFVEPHATAGSLKILEEGAYNFTLTMLGAASTGNGFVSIKNVTNGRYVNRGHFTDLVSQETGTSGSMYCAVNDQIHFEYFTTKNMNWGGQVNVLKVS